MSPTHQSAAEPAQRFPRVSGDEPDERAEGHCVSVFSPRERG